jgi:hypothetical protein
MLKKLILFPFIAVLLLAACNTGNSDKAAGAKADTIRIAVLTFEQDAAKYVDSAVVIEGTVFHTCKYGGKRMFLVDGTDSILVEVTTGPDIPKFDEKLVGSRVRVFGTVKELRIDEKYLAEWENEVKNPKASETTGVHTGAKGHEDQGTREKLDQINAYRDQIRQSGKDHLSFYTVEALSFTELK